MTSCKKKTEKKYLSRKSPSYSAMDCKGKTMKGTDGLYQSKPDKNNIYKWIKKSSLELKNFLKKSITIKSRKNGKTTTTRKVIKLQPKPVSISLELNGTPKHKYQIHDNGSRPYVVYDYGDRVEVLKQEYDDETKKYVIVKKLMDTKYKKIFVGDNDLKLEDYEKKGWGKGNSILLQVGPGKYIYIGDGIREFTTKDGDKIEKYYSPVGNNDVPYPYAVGKKYTYFMLDNGTVKEGPKYKYVENENVDLTKDAYSQLYGWSQEKEEIQNKTKTLVNSNTKVYSVKVLRKRFE